jgi:hypothetical protein
MARARASDVAKVINDAIAAIPLPDLTPKIEQVVYQLTATATDRGTSRRDDQYGYGIVNPVAALTADVPTLPASPTGPPSTPDTNIASPADYAPTVLVGILIAMGAAAAAEGVVINRPRTRR